MKTIRCFKITNSDWHCSYRLDGLYYGKNIKLCEVSFMQIDDGCWRVCVWGNDDDGMERDYEKTLRHEAFMMFKKIISQDAVNKNFLIDNNFIRA